MSESSPVPSFPVLNIAELEAKYPLYCRAMRLLLKEGNTQKMVERTVCWDRLATLHQKLPKIYKSPEYLFWLFRRECEHEMQHNG
jgi:hypothetical protein